MRIGSVGVGVGKGRSLIMIPDGQGMRAVLLPMDRDMFASSWFIEHRVEARALDGGQIAERYTSPVLSPRLYLKQNLALTARFHCTSTVTWVVCIHTLHPRRTWAHAEKGIYVCVCVGVRVAVCVYMCMYIYACVCMYVCSCVCVCVLVGV